MPQESYCHPELPILALFSQNDPLRELLREYSHCSGVQLLFFDHLCDAVSRAPLCGHGQAVIITARLQHLSPAGITAFGMLFGSDCLRCIVWDSGRGGSVPSQQNACFVRSIEQFDAAVRSIRKQLSVPAPAQTPLIDYCTPKPVLSDFRLTEDEMNALLGVT